MSKLKIFVASSSAAKRQAKMFIEHFDNDYIEFLPWWEQFTPGRTLLDELNRIRNEINAALLFITPEASTTNSKGNEIVIPNMNVLFEFGFFYSFLGKDKVAIIKYSQVDLPSDLSGYIHITGSKFFKHNNGCPIGKKTEQDFNKWFTAMISNV